MSVSSILTVTLCAEGGLLLIALLWSRLSGLTLRLGDPFESLLLGLFTAGVMGFTNVRLLSCTSRWLFVKALRRFYDALLVPMFSKVRCRDIVLISVAAGIGEELLFRGVIQPTIGLVPASVIFGIAHFGGRGMLMFGIWAGLMGLIFGWLAVISDGLLAPIVAHAGYDAIALTYIRRGGVSNVSSGSGEPCNSSA